MKNLHLKRIEKEFFKKWFESLSEKLRIKLIVRRQEIKRMRVAYHHLKLAVSLKKAGKFATLWH